MIDETDRGHDQDEAERAEGAMPSASLALETHPEARTWGMVCHLAGLGGLILGLAFAWIPVVGAALPFVLGLAGPVVVWQTKRADHAFIDEQGKEAFNFQLTVLIAALVLFVVGFATAILCIGFLFWFLLIPLCAAALVLTIIAAVKANQGEHYRYPFAMRFVF